MRTIDAAAPRAPRHRRVRERDAVQRHDVPFVEEQRFRQPWLLAVVGIATVAAWSGLVAAVVESPKSASTWVVVVVTAIVGIGLPVLFAVGRLRVEVHHDSVVIRFRPLATRTILLTDVRSAEAVSYRPLRDYGGWGIKGWSRRKVAYNVRGHRGVLLTLADGGTVLLGSQRADDLAAAIHRSLPARPA
jgi:hypothetical protein